MGKEGSDITNIIMRKINIILAVLTMASGCSKNDVYSNKESGLERTVRFHLDDDFNSKVATRGTSLDNTDPIKANGFYVSIKGDSEPDYSPSKHVTLQEGNFQNGAITWKAGDNYTFNAYYPNTVADVFEVATSGAPNITYNMPSDVIKHIDIVAATKQTLYDNSPVNLEFNHITSGLKFKLVDASSGNVNLSIGEIAIHGLTSKATYDVQSKAWNSAQAATSLQEKSEIVRFIAGRELKYYEDYPDDKTTAFSIMNTDSEAMFFPRQNEADLSDLAIFVTVKITVNTKTQQTVVKINGNALVENGQTLIELISSIESGQMLELTMKYDQFIAGFVIKGKVIPWSKKTIWFPDYE